MATRLVLAAPPRRGILQQNVNLENEKENQEQPPPRKGVILMTPKHEPLDDDDDWKSSPKRGYVTNSDGGHQRRRHKMSSNAPQTAPPSHVIARRNERERNRVRQVNDSFSVLRSRIPEYLYDAEVDEKGKQTRRKLSKVETLRLAVDYIQQLEGLLNIKQESRMDDSEEDGFFSSAENTQGSLFRVESEADLSPEGAGLSQDESSSDVANPGLFGQLEATGFKYKEDLFLVGSKRKCSELEDEPSDMESAAGSPLPPISETFPSKLSYDMYVPYGLVDLSAKAE